MNWKWIVDVSHYQRLTRAQWQTMKDHGLAGAVFKLGQGLLGENSAAQAHADNLAAIDVPYGGYFWPDPLQEWEPQVEAAVNLVNKFRPKFVASDCEQYWSNWELYLKARQGWNVKVPIFTSHFLYEFYSQFLEGMLQEVPKRNSMLYSSKWFIDGYCPSLAKYANSMSYWNARYYAWHDQDRDKLTDWNELEAYLQTLVPTSSGLPKNVNTWSMWQVSDTIVFDGMPVIDLNITPPLTYQLLFFPDVAPPAPEPPPTPTSLGYYKTLQKMNVRSEPSVHAPIIGSVDAGTTLPAWNLDGSDAWIEYNKGQWVCLRLGKEVFLKRV